MDDRRRTLAAFDSGSGGALPARVPAADVDIRILRHEARLLVPQSVRITAPSSHPATHDHPDRLRLRIVGELFCDEMVLVYGRPLCWTGEVGPNRDGLRHVERIFEQVFALDSERTEVLTPRPSVDFPEGHSRVAWSFGAVLVRGDDPPWAGSGLVHIDRSSE